MSAGAAGKVETMIVHDQPQARLDDGVGSAIFAFSEASDGSSTRFGVSVGLPIPASATMRSLRVTRGACSRRGRLRGWSKYTC